MLDSQRPTEVHCSYMTRKAFDLFRQSIMASGPLNGS